MRPAHCARKGQGLVKGGNCGESKSNAVPRTRGGGTRVRSVAVLVLATVALTVPITAIADNHQRDAFVDAKLLAAAKRNPDGFLRVIVQGDDGTTTGRVAEEVSSRLDDNSSSRDALTGRFQSITGVAATLTGTQVLQLAKDGAIDAITGDVPIVSSSGAHSVLGPADADSWIRETGLFSAQRIDGVPRNAMPAIAVVDSGIEARGEVGSRTIGEISMTQLSPNASGDGHGHGTLVAGIAAAAAPGAHLIGIDVMDDQGKAMTSDVIAAADWVQQNKDRYRIRVANFSLHATRPSSFRSDPLDRAVERLWLGGVVVVTSAGNYRLGSGPSGVPFAPANDPFVITVGATDLGSVVGGADDFNAPWSAYGRTPDGFLKPDLGAPGRRLIGPVPVDSTIAAEHPDRIVNRGRMRMSGTSFAAPIVAGAAAHLLARHPNWTPDEVKGALMVSARHAGRAEDSSIGTGELDVRAALKITQPPNPNRALARFLVEDSSGSAVPVFDSASWDSAADTDASWDSASWADASWADASWADASWADASWADASWADASWADASWADASWVD
jgi:serine protease AprX